MMTGVTLIVFVLATGALMLLPEGDADFDALKRASDNYATVRIASPGLPPSLEVLIKDALPELVADAGKVSDLQKRLQEFEEMGAVESKVAEAIRAALPPELKPTVQNGRVQLEADLLFPANSAEADRGLSAKVGDALIQVLANPELSKNIRYVILQGHSDATGTVEHNLQLSSARATNMVARWHIARPDYFPDSGSVAGETCVGAKIFAGGFGESRPRPVACKLDCPQNRRIDIEIFPKPARDRTALPACP